MGNGFAYFMLAFWPVLTLYLYSTRSVQKATLWGMLGGFLILPVRTVVDLPWIPPLDKYSIPVLSVLVGCRFVANKRIGFFDNKGVLKLLVILLLVSPLITVMNNKEAIVKWGLFLPGLTNHDAVSVIVNQLLFVAPFFVGRRFFRSYEDQLLLFKTMVLAGLVYSLFILFEVRMSPQLHTWIYGYFPHSFAQQIRFEGFRPVVFIGHGLEVAFFITLVLISSVAMWVSQYKIGPFRPKYTTVYTLFILFLCKSVAAFIYGLFSLLVVGFMSSKRVVYIALFLASLAVLYPIMSITHFFPHQTVIELAKAYDEERAQSLEFRFNNEAILLEHANEKTYFGWGGWGRNRIYDEEGRDISVTDGTWIIQFGQFGWAGFVAMFGLMYLTIIKAGKALKNLHEKKEQQLLAVHALIVAVVMVDQLPNSSLVPFYWLIIGILFGRSEEISQEGLFSPKATAKP